MKVRGGLTPKGGPKKYKLRPPAIPCTVSILLEFLKECPGGAGAQEAHEDIHAGDLAHLICNV